MKNQISGSTENENNEDAYPNPILWIRDFLTFVDKFPEGIDEAVTTHNQYRHPSRQDTRGCKQQCDHEGEFKTNSKERIPSPRVYHKWKGFFIGFLLGMVFALSMFLYFF